MRLLNVPWPPLALPGQLLTKSAQLLTTRGDADGLLQPLVHSGREAEGHHHHSALGGAHQQTGAHRAVHLPGVTLTEVKGGDGLSRFSIYAGHT